MDTTPSSVVCFMNGYSYVTTPVSLPDKNASKDIMGQYMLGPLPDFAVHGTIDIKPADSASTLKIFSMARSSSKDVSKDMIDVSKDLIMPSGSDFSFASFLAANLNSKVVITLKENGGGVGSSVVEGKIKWVQPLVGDQPRMAVIEARGINDDDTNSNLIDCSKITHVKQAADKEENVNMLVRYAQGGNCNLSYLTRGLTWAPTYSILLDRKVNKLKLEGKATLLCDLPSFTGAPVKEFNLVVGKPNMVYQSLSDPLVSGTTAINFIKQLAKAERNRIDPHGFTMKRGGPSEAADEYDEIKVDDAEGIEKGEEVDDFFFYNLKNVPLSKGQPLMMPFLADTGYVEYENIYHLDLSRNDDYDMPDPDQSEDKKNMVDVQHSIIFINPFPDQPLTTGSVSVYAKQGSDEERNKFLVQGLLKFTGSGQKTTVNITKALDVQAKFLVDTGTERKVEVVTEGAVFGIFDTGKTYAEVVEQKAKLIINNSKNSEIKCKVEYELVGHLGSSSPSPLESIERGKNNIFSRSLNPKTKLVWELKVPAKGQSEISFDFKVKELQRDHPASRGKHGGRY